VPYRATGSVVATVAAFVEPCRADRAGAADPGPCGLDLLAKTVRVLLVGHPVADYRDAEARPRASETEIRALGVARLAVFGSVLRGTPTSDSDVDVLVQFLAGRKTFDSFLALSEFLESRLGRRVDLVTTESLSPFLGPHILAEAQDVLRAA
jgi:uncharacterized protein